MTPNQRPRTLGLTLAVSCVLALSAGLALAQQDDLDRVTFRLNWKITGPHAAYYLGHELGFYEEEGIDLQLMEGNGSGNTAMLVGNKSDTFGLADAAAVIPLAAQELPVVAVGMVSPRTSLAVIARADRGIEELHDLEGSQLAVTAGDALTQIWPAVVGRNDLSDVQLVYVDAAAKVPMVLEGRADALLGSSSDQNFILEAEGVPATALDFADYGVNVLNLAIWAHEDLVEQDPDLIRRFLRATKRSIEALQDDPDHAVELITQAKPELDPTVASNQTRAYMAQFVSPNCPEAALLHNCPEDWEQTLEIMKEYRELDIEAPASAFYTNELLE